MKANGTAAALCLACLVAGAAALDDEAWGPSDGVKALSAVEAALDKIVSNPHLGKARLQEAAVVVADVKKDMELVESGHNLTKAARNQKVADAVGQLMRLAHRWQANATAADGLRAKMASLKKQLAEKQAELAKDETMIKLATLQKELAEKKLQLQKLMEMKQGAGSKKEAEEEAASRGAENKLVAEALSATKGLKQQDLKGPLPKPMQALLSELRAHTHNVSEAIDRMDAEDKKSKADMEAALKPGKGAEGAKAASLLKTLEREQARKHAKARALKKAELVDLTRAQKSLEARDAAGLAKVLAKMQSETKAAAAKSGKFLY